MEEGGEGKRAGCSGFEGPFISETEYSSFCLRTLCQNKYDYLRPPPLFCLGAGTDKYRQWGVRLKLYRP